jgi:hypothetical protein
MIGERKKFVNPIRTFMSESHTCFQTIPDETTRKNLNFYPISKDGTSELEIMSALDSQFGQSCRIQNYQLDRDLPFGQSYRS